MDVTDGVSTATVTIAISVIDVNEGPPEFTSSGKNSVAVKSTKHVNVSRFSWSNLLHLFM